MLTYEWDEAKGDANFDKHGLGFALAKRVYEAEFKATLASPRENEARCVDIAEFEGQLLALVYTFRPNGIRVISLRKANRKEKRRYAETKNSSLHQ